MSTKDRPVWQLTQNEIAERTGLSQTMVSMTIRGDKMPSVETALKLEKATGICREAWLFPERHFNPYMPFVDGISCLCCPNRAQRAIWMMERIGELVEQYPRGERLQWMQPIMEQYHRGMGFPKELFYGLYVRRKYDYLAVAAYCFASEIFPVPFSISRVSFPYLYDRMRRGSPFISNDLMADLAPYPEDRASYAEWDATKVLLYPEGRLVTELLIRQGGPEYRFPEGVFMSVSRLLKRLELALGGELDEGSLRKFINSFPRKI